MSIKKSIFVTVNLENAFEAFVNDFNHWWPPEYTWSQDSLKEIRIGKERGELCTEIASHKFHCDWGRITEFEKNKSIQLKWQIGPNREPVPNPDHASDLHIMFKEILDSSTEVRLEHQNFDNHGEGFKKYQTMMNSAQGWPFILQRFKNYCENEIK